MHTPRNEFTTLLEGRKKYPLGTKKVKKYEINGTPIGNVGPDGRLRDGYVMVDEPVAGTNDFSKMPALQPAYMIGTTTSHNIDKAIAELRAGIKGFVVEMPLEWGVREKTTPKPPLNDPSMIAMNLSRRNRAAA
jgi:phospholipase D1/2